MRAKLTKLNEVYCVMYQQLFRFEIVNSQN